MSVSAPAHPATARLLWIDDQIASFGSHIDDLKDSGYSVTTVATADEALSTIRRGDRFDAILVDLKMPDSDGIKLLVELQAEVTDLETTRIIVLSSFLYDRIIRRRLIDLSMNVALLEKTHATADGTSTSLADRLTDILKRDDIPALPGDQFTNWDRIARGSDPFEISLESYLDSPIVVRLQLDQKARAATKKVRSKLARDGVIWSLFCGSSKRPIRTAVDPTEIPSDEEIFSSASGEGHPPYEFYEGGEFEEHTATSDFSSPSTGEMDGCPGAPDYPFFRIIVVHRSQDVSFNRSRDFHFDSGLDVTAFDLEAALQIGLNVDSDKPTKFVQYGDSELAFYSVSGDAFVDRANHGSLEVTINGRAYIDWESAPFSRRCADFSCAASDSMCFRRHALLGRNLLVENELQLDLRRMNGTRAYSDNE